MNYALHPLCTLFPRMAGAELGALVSDIRANGLRSPIVLHDGMILDGGNRYRACMDAGVAPEFVRFSGGNPVSFVLSVNLHRRHMSAPQQAAIVASAQDWANAQTHGGDRKYGQVLPRSLDTTKDRAARSGASVSTQRRADAVAKADPELAKQVGLGNVSLPSAVARVAPQLASRKPEPVKTATQTEDDKQKAEAFADFDPLVELETAQREIEKLSAEIDAAEADDLKAEALKWRRVADQAQREQSRYMDLCEQGRKRETWGHRQLMRCGKAVGETDPEKIAASVEVFVREHKAVAA